MKTLLALTTITAILFIVINLNLLIKIQKINKKSKYVDEANMWHKLAVTDDLTGVYNRNAYNLHIDNIKNEEINGIVLFDIDDFKRINDTEGHMAGDIVLKNVAKNLLKVFCEPQYKVFRIGGDEFSVLAKDVSETEIIKRLIQLKKLFETEGNISFSKGYSIIKDNLNESFNYADEMLYADKRSKRDRHF